jgi:hypothetical protein
VAIAREPEDSYIWQNWTAPARTTSSGDLAGAEAEAYDSCQHGA